MWVLGLTGGIGAGKSTLSKYLKYEGIPVHSADREIHCLLRTDPEIQHKIRELWPDVFINGNLDRKILGDRALSSPGGLLVLEDILYPKLAQRQREFLFQNQKRKASCVVLDIPLLFETGLDQYCDFVILASAPFFLRKQRVLRREGMTLKKFQTLESHQMKEVQRKKRADFVISCGRDKGSALKKIKHILYFFSQKPSPQWNGRWPINIIRSLHGTRNCFRHRNNRI